METGTMLGLGRRCVYGQGWRPVIVAVVAALVCGAELAIAGGPFSATLQWRDTGEEQGELSATFSVPPGHHIYDDSLAVDIEPPAKAEPLAIPPAEKTFDALMEKEVGAYARDVTFTYHVSQVVAEPLYVRLRYQGCSESVCFPPVDARFAVYRDGRVEPADRQDAAVPESGASWRSIADTFAIRGRIAGYLPPAEFLAFLDEVEKAGPGAGPVGDTSDEVWSRGLFVTLLTILIGGFLLNLTPCVLPMIPVNLAIIGAGVRAGSRRRGFLLGGAYGAGIALVYGALGVVVVLTGARFGELNASPWFNLAIAIVFLVLSLAMFGVFNLDFSRFQSGRLSTRPARGPWVTAFVFGGIAALLAGACVAPVVFTVLTLATKLYASGQRAALLLPFVLGLGMALPWPFAGAGMSFLPRPGQWMERIKKLFGVVIIAAAVWYGWLAWTQFFPGASGAGDEAVAAGGDVDGGAHAGWYTSLEEALNAARAQNRPLFIDFWASWCKNCKKMEATTFPDAAVAARLQSYVKLKYRAEKPAEPETRAVLDYFGAPGLPTYVVARPAK